MTIALIIIWILFPLIFYSLALWSYLEQSTQVKKGKRRNEEPKDLFKQALFVTACSVVTALFDYLFIQSGSLDWAFGDYTPKPLMRFLLYPVVLFLGAKAVGGTPAPHIDQAPKPSQRYKKRFKG